MSIDPVPALPSGRPIVFYSPHQDDETLWMGQIIAHHALAGRQVHLVLCANGSNSAALAEINGAPDFTWWGGPHYPAREGYQPLTADEFGLARTREFLNAAGQLGVPEIRVHFGRADQIMTSSDELPTVVTSTWAAQIIESWAEHFAVLGFDQVGHYTTHWNDPQPDHSAMGQALLDLHIGGGTPFADARWTVKPDQVASTAGAGTYGLPTSLAAQIKGMAKHAAWSYKAWAPRGGSYGIGYHSVGPQFIRVESEGPNYITGKSS